MSGGSKLPVEVAIVDKSPLVQSALKGLLAEDDRFRLAFVASDGERFLDALARLRCDVAVIGWVMPHRDGRGVLEALKDRPESPRVIVYTGHSEPTLPRRVMALGAAAFVSKQEPPERLLDAIEAVARGQMVFPFLDVRALHACRPIPERAATCGCDREQTDVNGVNTRKLHAFSLTAGASAGSVRNGLSHANDWREKNYGAEERTRTSTVLLPPAPQAGASANSATSASQGARRNAGRLRPTFLTRQALQLTMRRGG